MSKHTLPPSRLAGLAWLCLAGLALPIHAQVMPAPANTQAAATSTETVRVLSLDELITTVVANNT